jgi:hypothetical protein
LQLHHEDYLEQVAIVMMVPIVADWQGRLSPVHARRANTEAKSRAQASHIFIIEKTTIGFARLGSGRLAPIFVDRDLQRRNGVGKDHDCEDERE